MSDLSNSIPPFREDYELSELDRKTVDRIREELDHRIGVDVSIDVYTQTPLVHPVPSLSLVYVELKVGNWKRIHTISQAELICDGVFFYFLRRVADAAMRDLVRLDARRA